MTNKLKKLFIKYREQIMYLIFGVLTTVVNFAVYFVMKRVLGITDDMSDRAFPVIAANSVAWVAAVLFAFVTNKLWVFGDRDVSQKTLLFQLASFFAARFFSFLFETACIFSCVHWLNWDEDIVKLAVAVVVVVINYVASKLWVFKKRK